MIKLADLTHITYAVTHHCNLACTWCFQGSSAKIPFEFDLAFRQRLLGRLASKERHLTLTGGEPFTYPDILPLLETALTLFRSVGVTSNGVRYAQDQIEFICEHRIPLAISVDGPEIIHDAVRGRGTFGRIKKNVLMFLDMGVPVSIQTTLSRGMVCHLDSFVEEMVSWGVGTIAFQRLQPVGRGLDKPGELLNAEESLQLAHRLKVVAQKYKEQIKIKTKDPLHRTLNDSLQLLASKYPRAVVSGCRAAISYLFVQVDGTAWPCPLLTMPLGNIMEQSLEDIWLRSPLLVQIRTRSCYQTCASCTNWAICRGCRAHALAHSDEVMGTDPMCWNTALVSEQSITGVPA